MSEVTKQLHPVLSIVQAVHEWQLSFWSNGSNKPPGFFQTRIKSDDQRYGQLIAEVEKLTDHKAAMDAFIIELRLTREMREKREEEAKERRSFWILKVALPITLAILSTLGVVIAKTAPVANALWDDYLRTHPTVSQQINK